MNASPYGDPEGLAEQAADWIARLGDDDPAERQRAQAGFLAWKQADARHAAAAAGLEGLLGRLDGIRRGGAQAPARQALHGARSPKGRLRRGAAALALAGALLLPGWFALQTAPGALLTADLRTSSGEWVAHTLADGTRLSLNSRSAVDVDFDAEVRSISLLRGEVLIDVARDGARPFVVRTAHGDIRALGTRLLVSRDDDATVLSMIESRVEVRIDGRELPIVVDAGRSLRFGPGIEPRLDSVDGLTLETAWQKRQLVVRDRPLTEVLDELERHRPGFIRYDRTAVAGLQVSGVLPLADRERSLQLLVANFPGLRIRTLTPYIVIVEHEEKR